MDLLKQMPFKIGVNYWPATTAIKMWSNWNSNEIAEDFRQISAAGFDLVRFFLFTPDFFQGGKVNSLQLKHYQTVLKHLEGADLYGLPTLFVGHMSGQNYRVDGWDEDTFFSDPRVREQQQEYIKSILKVSSKSRHIAGWCLSNEMSNDFPGKNATEVTNWVRMISELIHDLDSRPLVIGDGVWSPEITGASYMNNLEPSANYRLRELASLQDTLGVHLYPHFDDYWPQAYTAGFRMLMARSWKDTVFLEEFGHSTAMGSEENQALYYREILFSALQTGASAALNWCWTDFEQPTLRPYLHNTFEMRFGLRRSDGSFRPALSEMQAVSKLSKELSAEGWEPAPRDSWFVIPANYYHPYPFDWDTEGRYNLYLHTYGALASAGAAPMCIHEPAVEYSSLNHENQYTHTTSFEQAPVTVWLPALKRISAPFWTEILEYVRHGGVLYASFATDHWVIDLDALLGIQSQLRFGLPECYPDAIMTISSPCSWGPFGSETISIHLGELRHQRSLGFLPGRVEAAEILLEDSAGRPLLIRKTRGIGYIYYSLFPFEILMTQSCNEDVRAFVTALYAGIREDIITEGSCCHTPGAEFMRYQRADESREFLFNHAWEPRVFQVRHKKSEKAIKHIRVNLPPKSFCEIDTMQHTTQQLEYMNAPGIEN